jgi:hypothetical protein
LLQMRKLRRNKRVQLTPFLGRSSSPFRRTSPNSAKDNHMMCAIFIGGVGA